MTTETLSTPQAPADLLRERIEDLHELRGRGDAELAKLEAQIRRIEAANITPAGLDSREVRAWGRAHGWVLGDRGRFPADLIHAYLHRRDRE